jgi:hypothetical protein
MEETKVISTEELIKLNQNRNIMQNRCGGLMENPVGIAVTEVINDEMIPTTKTETEETNLEENNENQEEE